MYRPFVRFDPTTLLDDLGSGSKASSMERVAGHFSAIGSPDPYSFLFFYVF